MQNRTLSDMDHKLLDKIAEVFRKEEVVHLILVRMGDGISMSSRMTGEDLFDFLQIVIDSDERTLDIIRDVVESRMEIKRMTDGSLLPN